MYYKNCYFMYLPNCPQGVRRLILLLPTKFWAMPVKNVDVDYINKRGWVSAVDRWWTNVSRNDPFCFRIYRWLSELGKLRHDDMQNVPKCNLENCSHNWFDKINFIVFPSNIQTQHHQSWLLIHFIYVSLDRIEWCNRMMFQFINICLPVADLPIAPLLFLALDSSWNRRKEPSFGMALNRPWSEARNVHCL